MKWQEAVSLSSVGVAQRDCKASDLEPWQVHAYISRRGKKIIQVFTKKRLHTCGVKSTTSQKRASQHDDWVPLRPVPTMLAIAISAEWNGRIRFQQRNKRKRRKRSSSV